MPITRPYGDVEHIFDDVLVPIPATVEAAMDLPVDVYEGEGEITVEAAVPGMKPEDISVDIEGKTLTITGKREVMRRVETNELTSQEITRGTVSRTVRLPVTVDEKRVKVSYDKGMLHLVLPKQA